MRRQMYQFVSSGEQAVEISKGLVEHAQKHALSALTGIRKMDLQVIPKEKTRPKASSGVGEKSVTAEFTSTRGAGQKYINGPSSRNHGNPIKRKNHAPANMVGIQEEVIGTLPAIW